MTCPLFAAGGDWFFCMLVQELTKTSSNIIILEVMTEDKEIQQRLEEAKVIM